VEILTCDIFYSLKNKAGEEICGDTIRIKRSENRVAVTVSDGLGSGIKASILSTLTASLATTMLFNNVDLEDVVKSIIATLPKCKVRDLSYANFCSVLFNADNSTLYLAEYDFPVVLLFRKSAPLDLPRKKVVIEGREMFETELQVEDGDVLFIMTDGVSQAGLGSNLYPLGFGIDNIRKEISNLMRSKLPPNSIVEYLIKKAQKMDEGTKGDDALCAALSFRPFNRVNIMVGPPSDPSLDEEVVKLFINLPGKKIVCGGTTSQVVSRVVGKEVILSKSLRKNSPPIGYMEGVDLVTEGIVTLAQVFRSLSGQIENIGRGADLLLKILDKADSVHFIVGKAINPVYQNPLFSYDLSLKVRVVEDIARLLREKGKMVDIEYY
jgi:hypothetical protein